jgi:hypothetical protein
MTIALDHAIELAKTLPPEAQDELANLILAFAEGEPTIELSPEEEAWLQESLDQADRGEFASDDEVKAMWAKYGL